MTWETKDVLVIVVAIGGVAATWGIVQTKVAGLAAELRELKRDTNASLKSQGERLGKIETATEVSRQLSKLVGAGTPALGTLLSQLRPPAGGRVSHVVEDDGSKDDDGDNGR